MGLVAKRQKVAGIDLKQVLLIDHFDSFAFNLAHYTELAGCRVEVQRSDMVSAARLLQHPADALILSPGPGNPMQTRTFVELIEALAARPRPILGICLGMQALATTFGAKIVRNIPPMHGKTSTVTCTDTPLFAGLPDQIEVTRYHSLMVEKHTLPACLEAIATSTDGGDDDDGGTLMGLRHSSLPFYGLQWHPESVLSQYGQRVITNFVEMLPVTT